VWPLWHTIDTKFRDRMQTHSRIERDTQTDTEHRDRVKPTSFLQDGHKANGKVSDEGRDLL
jgi:hypothetical protein